MPLSEQQREQLEDLQFQLGTSAGSLAFALDQLTEVMALLAQHAVRLHYGQSARPEQWPAALRTSHQSLADVKSLVQAVLLDLKNRLLETQP